MSHLVEEYAKNLGVKIAKPTVAKHFYPLLVDKYITVYCESTIESKKYHYFNIVIDLIKNSLNKFDIKVVQIGAKENSIIPNTDACYGDLTFKQNAYILSKSLLHIGVDNVFSHYVSSLNIPLVSIFGNIYPEISDGFWSSKDRKANIKSLWSEKPCLNLVDPENSINKIKPELIAQSILDQLKINGKVNIKTRHIGNSFKDKIMEVVPNFFQPYQELKDQIIYLRLDYGFDANYFMQWCQWCNVSIFTDKIIPLEIINKIYPKIKNLSFILNKENNLDDFYIRNLKSKKINFQILVKEEDQIAEIQEKYFEVQVRPYKTLKKENLNDEYLNIKNTFFTSGKTILSNGKRYPSKYHWQKDENIIDKNLNIEDDDVFYEELNHYFIYERI
jgi:hypothetical protein